MKHLIMPLLVLCCFWNVANPESDIQSKLLFDRLRALEGKWDGTARWIEIPDSEFKMRAVYSLTGRGTAIVEDLISEGVTTMTSVYHLDGDTLRMTHYCGAGNQPRLKALADQRKTDRIKFQILDVTNLVSPDSAHVVGAEIIFQDRSNITLSFDFVRQGKINTEMIQLHRVD